MMKARSKTLPAENTRARRLEVGAVSTCIVAIIAQGLCVKGQLLDTALLQPASVHTLTPSAVQQGIYFFTNFVNNS